MENRKFFLPFSFNSKFVNVPLNWITKILQALNSHAHVHTRLTTCKKFPGKTYRLATIHLWQTDGRHISYIAYKVTPLSLAYILTVGPKTNRLGI